MLMIVFHLTGTNSFLNISKDFDGMCNRHKIIAEVTNKSNGESPWHSIVHVT